MGGISSIPATAVGFKKINQQVQDSIGELANSDGTSPEKKAILNEMSEDLDENPIHIVDETGSRIKQNVGANPEGVKTALIEGMSQLENITTRLTQESGNINHQGLDIENAHNAYMDYASGKGSMETAATAMAEDIQTALEMGRLTETEANKLKGVMGELVGDVDSTQNIGDNRIGVTGTGNTIDGIPLIDGKIGGKIPVDEFKKIRQASIKNPDADSMTLGKFEDGGANSYITKAGKDSSYFDMGNDFKKVMQKYNLSYDEMFEYFNKPALKDAITSGKTIRFSHDPINDDGFLGMEWDYIKEALHLTDKNLFGGGGIWYVK